MGASIVDRNGHAGTSTTSRRFVLEPPTWVFPYEIDEIIEMLAHPAFRRHYGRDPRGVSATLPDRNSTSRRQSLPRPQRRTARIHNPSTRRLFPPIRLLRAAKKVGPRSVIVTLDQGPQTDALAKERNRGAAAVVQISASHLPALANCLLFRQRQQASLLPPSRLPVPGPGSPFTKSRTCCLGSRALYDGSL